jgi:hypothetical protein
VINPCQPYILTKGPKINKKEKQRTKWKEDPRPRRQINHPRVWGVNHKEENLKFLNPPIVVRSTPNKEREGPPERRPR